MLKYLQNKPVVGIIAACVVICSALIRPADAGFGGAGGVLAPTRIQYGDYDRGRSRDRQPVNRQQQAKQAIETAARDMDQMLVQILEMVNRQARPQQEMLDTSKRAVIAAKQYATRYSTGLKCEILMLQAWNGYFANNMREAMERALNAYKTDSTNQDAEATHVTMALLMDRKPQKIAPRRQRPTTPVNNSRGGRRNSRGDSYTATQNARDAEVNVRASSGNILDLNIDAIDLDLIGQTVPPMQVNCLNSTTFDYDPAQSTLCLLFWQLGSKNASGEPNNMMPGMSTGRGGRAGAGYTGGRGGGYNERGRGSRGDYYDERGRGGTGGYDSRGRRDYEDEGDYGAGYRQPAAGRPVQKVASFASEMTAYGQLFGSYLVHPKVKFLAVNTDPLRSAPTVVNKLLESPWPWAHVMAANTTGGMAQYADMDFKQPKLAIVSSGTIKYAGPAAGFLPPMMLTRLAGEPPSTSPTRPPGVRTSPITMINPFKGLFGGGNQRPPANTATGSTGTGRATPPPPPNRIDEDDDEITPESYQAGKLLENAKIFVSIGRKPVMTSLAGIKLCRQIIRDYPNTKYEQEARLLLRRVPAYERKRYNITDKEMGL